MGSPEPLRPLSSAIVALEAWLRRDRIPHVFIGGVAVSLLSRPRTTRDVDGIVLVPGDDLGEFASAAERSGFRPRIADAVAFATSSRVFLLRHEGSGTSVDLSAGQLGFEKDAIRRARKLVAFGTTLPVVSPADLVILKAVAGRPQDYADISAVLESNPRLDLSRVRRIVGQFAEALEAPELREQLESALARGRRPRARR